MKSVLDFARRHWFVIMIAAGIGGGGWYYFSQGAASTETAAQLRTVRAERGDLRVAVSGSGQVQAQSQVDLKPVIAGDGIDVIDVRVKNDQAVEKGQVIAVLDTEDAMRDIENAELSLKSATIKQKQTNDDFPGKTTDDTRQRQAQGVIVKQQEIAFAKTREKLQDYYIKAPFDGIVTGLSVEAGDSLSRETILASVITREMKVDVSLNEVDAAKVKEGNKATLAFDAKPDLRVSGTVVKLDTIGTVEQGVVSYGAEIRLDEQNDMLKPGMSVSAEIVVTEKTGVLLIPNAALAFENGKAYANVIDGAMRRRPAGAENGASRSAAPSLERREIGVGLTDDVNTEVESGLNEGDAVVISAGSGASVQTTGGAPQQRSLLNIFRGSGGTGQRSGGFGGGTR